MALTAVMPSVAKASILSAAPTAEGENQQLKAGVYFIVNDKRQAGTDLHVYVDESGLHGKNYTSLATDYSNAFLLHAKGDKYTIQSLKDGKYVQNVNGNQCPLVRQATTLISSRLFISHSQVVRVSLTSISIMIMQEEPILLALDAQRNVVRWYPLRDNGRIALGPSEFRLDPVTSLSKQQVLDRLAELTKIVDPRKD